MRLAETVAFGGSGLDRAAQVRRDDDGIAALLQSPGAGILPVWRGKPLFVNDGEHETPGWLGPSSLVVSAAPIRVFLGFDNGAPRFAVDLSLWEPDLVPDTLGAFHDPSEQRHPSFPWSHRFMELRSCMTRLRPRDAELVATAKALLGWHASHSFCAACGAPSHPTQAGWQRECLACATKHFPRTDPVVIMLITRGNRVLLGRSPAWPESMYSLLAGFVEPGETLEAAVRRETLEEVGVRVGRVGYLASQPWPFPSSLMIGCHGEALSDEIRPDPVEIEHALWISREDLMDVFAGTNTTIKPAREGAIAHFLLKRWLADRLD